MSAYIHLTQRKLYQMEAFYKASHNQTIIAIILSIHKPTVSRLLKRNRGVWTYRLKQVHVMVVQR
jgi:IS30 family transposase